MRPRIDRRAALADFEVELVLIGEAGFGDGRDHLAPLDRLPARDGDLCAMAVGAQPAIAMPDEDEAAVDRDIGPDIGDDAVGSGLDRSADGGGDVDAVIAAP